MSLPVPPSRTAVLAAVAAASLFITGCPPAAVQGKPVELGGYYRPEPAKARPVITPLTTMSAFKNRLTIEIVGAVSISGGPCA